MDDDIIRTAHCQYCCGTGLMACRHCNGTGYSPYGGQCHYCYGEGDEKCDVCGGSGIVIVDENYENFSD